MPWLLNRSAAKISVGVYFTGPSETTAGPGLAPVVLNGIEPPPFNLWSSPCAEFCQTLIIETSLNVYLTWLAVCFLWLLSPHCLHSLLHCCTITFVKVTEPLGLYHRHHSRGRFSLVRSCKSLTAFCGILRILKSDWNHTAILSKF